MCFFQLSVVRSEATGGRQQATAWIADLHIIWAGIRSGKLRLPKVIILKIYSKRGLSAKAKHLNEVVRKRLPLVRGAPRNRAPKKILLAKYFWEEERPTFRSCPFELARKGWQKVVSRRGEGIVSIICQSLLLFELSSRGRTHSRRYLIFLYKSVERLRRRLNI